ncbi:MAG: hypothetical protein IPG50_19845 [Myxococcales bacterium]|nr:hypothetical protein [Myxococcales bacterium]
MKPMRMLLAATALLFTFGTVAVASAHDGGSKDKPSFPMKADEFQKRIDTRVNKMRVKLSERLAEKNVAADKAKEIRDRFEAGVTKVNAATKQAVADGVVTQDEAKAVRSAMHEMRSHHGRKHKDQKKS